MQQTQENFKLSRRPPDGARGLRCIVSYLVGLSLTASGGGTLGCKPPSFDQKIKSKVTEAIRTIEVVRGRSELAGTHHQIRFEQRNQRRLDLELRFPTDGRSELTLMMPVWIPGSYLMREFSRNVIAPMAYGDDGQPLPLTKTAKNRLQIQSLGSKSIRLRYQLYANELTVRTSFVGREYAVINPACTLFVDTERENKPVSVELVLPSDWSAHASMSTQKSSERVGTSTSVIFKANNFDELIDSPIIAGRRVVQQPFEAHGISHELVHVGDLRYFPLNRALQDVTRLTGTLIDFWGHIPYPDYHFLNVIDDIRGGLEHKNSTLIMTPSTRGLSLEEWRLWLGLVSHEFFHAWNGKRLRPAILGPFNLETEAYTESLWFVEGITSYYDDLLLRRAELHTDDSYLARLASMADQMARTPGQLYQSLSRSSYDAWIEYYRPDAESTNTAISYYTKGALVGWIIDADIRQRTRGDKSLDDVLRTAYARYSGARGYEDSEIYKIFEDVAGPEVRAHLEELVHEPAPLSFELPLRVFGLRVQRKAEETQTHELSRFAASAQKSSLGIKTVRRDHRVWVHSVEVGDSAWKAGIAPEDEIVAISGDRLSPRGNLNTLLKRHQPGDEVEILIARRGRMLVLPVELGETPKTVVFEIDPQANATARQHRRAWLNGS